MRTAWQDDSVERSVTSPLSLVISAFAPVLDVRQTVTPQLRLDKGDTRLLLVDVAAGMQRLGGSILAQTQKQMGDEVPDVDDPTRLRAFFNAMQELLEQELVLAYHDRSDGGLLTTLAEMAFAGRCGWTVDIGPLEGPSLAALFNEELGAVLQVRAADYDHIESVFVSNGFSGHLHVLGQPHQAQAVQISRGEQILLQSSRSELQQQWASVSFQMQSLRDNTECARQEYETIVADDPGLSAHLAYDPNADVSAPFIARGIRPRVAILREQGVNGQVEMAAAFHRAGFEAVDVHMSDILAGRCSLDEFKGLAACGGFSYGDVLGAGEGWAKTILFNATARDQFHKFFSRGDTFSLGVCNGCQMLSNLKDLIPGAEHWPHFVRNASEQFEARVSLVKIEKSPSVLLADMAGSHMPVAVAHGEGQAEFSNVSALNACNSSGLVSIRYIDNKLDTATRYPANPNGSPHGITGITSRDGRATILMPHPERVFRAVTNSWKPDSWQEDGAWMRLFRNARVFVS